ncbi:MAG: phosphomannomutase, partial [Devosia sp.]
MSESLKFGTSGLRGLAVELVGAESRRYAAAFLAHLRNRGWIGRTVLIGRDLRASSPAIARDIAAALIAGGVDVLDAGEVPTPALALAAITRKLPAVMITGSHIPGDRNGLKFYRPDGEIGKGDEAGIALALAGAPVGEARATEDRTMLAGYRARYENLIQPKALSGWRIGVWQHSSVARDFLTRLLGATGAEIVPLGRSDSFVPVDTEAVSADAVARIDGWVRELRLDALVSTDGDADRPLLADETGAVMRGDVLGVLAARALGAQTVVTPVTSISTVEALFDHVVRTKVGSPYVIEGMRDAAAPVIGFEANGGLLLGSAVSIGGQELSALPTRDAVLPLLAVFIASLRQGRSLSELAAELPARFSRSDR